MEKAIEVKGLRKSFKSTEVLIMIVAYTFAILAYKRKTA